MNKKIYLWIIHHVYGVPKPLNQNKLKLIDHIGNKAFMISLIYILLSSSIFSLIGYKQPEEALVIMIFSNLLFLLFVISGYLGFKVAKYKWTINEGVAKTARKSKFLKLIRNLILSFLYFGFLDVFTTYLLSNEDIVTILQSPMEYLKILISSIILVGGIWLVNFSKAKR